MKPFSLFISLLCPFSITSHFFCSPFNLHKICPFDFFFVSSPLQFISSSALLFFTYFLLAITRFHLFPWLLRSLGIFDRAASYYFKQWGGCTMQGIGRSKVRSDATFFQVSQDFVQPTYVRACTSKNCKCKHQLSTPSLSLSLMYYFSSKWLVYIVYT